MHKTKVAAYVYALLGGHRHFWIGIHSVGNDLAFSFLPRFRHIVSKSRLYRQCPKLPKASPTHLSSCNY